MTDYIRTISQEKFSMVQFRDERDNVRHECNSIGCVIGHCTVLDKPENIPYRTDGELDFYAWSEKFTGIEFMSPVWDWCFSGDWGEVDNTTEGAAKRIEYLLEKGLPDEFEETM